MSFAYLAFYTGDYLRDTRHLTPLKHGVYLLLLMHCWDSRGPAPLDEQECAGIANCRSADEIDALRYVLRKYFILLDDGWYNSRIQKEIERAQKISVVREDAGRRGANERMRRFREAQANAKQMPSNSLASDATPTTTTISTTNTTPPKSTPSAPKPKIGFDAVEGRWIGIPAETLALWKNAYPAIDLNQNLHKAAAWMIANPANKKKNYERFIVGWLSRAQEKAPRVKTETSRMGNFVI